MGEQWEWAYLYKPKNSESLVCIKHGEPSTFTVRTFADLNTTLYRRVTLYIYYPDSFGTSIFSLES